MSIRSNSLPVGRDLSPELQEILRRNGMQAHIIRQGEGYQLAVQGHDSPLLTYSITAQQMRDLVDWGTNSANKKAYNTFASLVSNDFYMPTTRHRQSTRRQNFRRRQVRLQRHIIKTFQNITINIIYN